MFLEHYGLRDQPFGVTPDARFLYFGATHREALASLYYGIETGCGFMALIASPGMGKTTLLLQLLDRLRSSAQTVFLFQTQCDSREFLRCLLTDLGIDAREQNLAYMHEALNSVLLSNARAGRRFVLVIDEAQNLEHSVLETVRLLSDFETPSAKLMQIVLSGQPQLADRLSHPDLLQLRQRISIVSRLQPFGRGETVLYIDNRLHIAGYSGPPLFTFEAIARIADHSGGIPRNINNICFSALTLGYAKGLKQIDATIVREVLADLRMDVLGSESMTLALANGDSSSSVEGPGPTDESSYQEFYAGQCVARAQAVGAEARTEAIHPESDPLPIATDPESNRPAVISQKETSAPVAAKSQSEQKPSSADGTATTLGSPPLTPPVKLVPRMPARPQMPANNIGGGGEQSQTAAVMSARAAGSSPEPSLYELKATPIEQQTPAPASLAHTTSTVRTSEASSPDPLFISIGSQGDVQPAASETRGTKKAASEKRVDPSNVSDALETKNPEQAPIAAELFRQTSLAGFHSPAATSPLRSGAGKSRKPLDSPRAAGIRTQVGKPSRHPKHWTVIAARCAVVFVVVGVGALFVHHNSEVDGAVTSTTAMAAQPTRNDIASASTSDPLVAPTRPAEAARTVSRPSLHTAVFSNGKIRQHGPLPVGGQLIEPRLLWGAVPEYPSVARREHVEGDVIVAIVVDESGSVSDMKVVSGPMILRQAALNSLDRWKYEPPKLDGQPVSVQAMVTIQFRL
jgi:general secretion pathway protein A